MNEFKNTIQRNKHVILLYWLLFTATGFVVYFQSVEEEKYQSKNNISTYILKNETYEKSKIELGESSKLNSLSVELAHVGAKQDETWLSGKLSFKISNPICSLKEYDMQSCIIQFVLSQKSFDYSYYPQIIIADCSRKKSSERAINCKEDKVWGYEKGHKYIPSKGSHYYYPIDNLSFDMEISNDHEIVFQKIVLYNRTDQFTIWSPLIEYLVKDRKVRIRFDLKRKISVRFAFCIIAMAIILYLSIILFYVRKPSELSASVGGFFFSLWSIRLFIGGDVKIFPTLLDYFVIWVSFGLLFGVVTKIAFGYFSEDN